MIIESLQDLTDKQFEIVEDPTLLDTPDYRYHRKRIDKLVRNLPGLSKRPPWEYQARNAAVASCRNRNLLAHEQGLGKTYETILILMDRFGDALLGKGHKKPRPNTITILAPRHTLNQAWKNEFKELGLDHLVDVVLDETDVRTCRKPIWLMDLNDFLKNQTQHGKNLDKLGKVRTRVNRYKEVEEYSLGFPMWKLIRRLATPSMVVIDEIHNLRADSARTAAVAHYVRGVDVRLGLTGTPIDGWVEHLACVLQIIYGGGTEVFPWDIKSFTSRFTRTEIIDMDYVTGEAGADPKRRSAPGINPDQIPEFYQATRHLMHRQIYRDPEVSAHVKFPPVKHHLHQCEMDEDHRKYYYDLHYEVMALIEEAVKAIDSNPTNLRALRHNVLTHLNLLRQASSCPWAIDPEIFRPYPRTPTAKMNELLGICGDAVADGRKFIIFTNFIATGGVITEFLQNVGFGVTRIYASDPNDTPKSLAHELREKRIEQFLCDPDTQGMVANLNLISTGLTLTQASVLIHHDHDWKSNPYKQGNSRAIRPGQVWDHVDIHDLVHCETSDRYVYYGMLNKVKANSEMIDREFSLGADKSKLDLDPVAIARVLLSGELRGS